MNSAGMTGPDMPRKPCKRVLAIHRYYWPDAPPYASMLKSIVDRWVEDGHSVDVLSSQPSYKANIENIALPAKSRLDGAKVYRLNLPNDAGKPFVKIFNMVRLCAAILYRAIIMKRYDVITVSTSPPVLAGFASALAAKITGARFIYHCMDIHPEIGRLSGEFSHPTLFRILQIIDSWSCKQANPVVVLSKDMESAIRLRDNSDNYRIKIINNFSLPADGEDKDRLPVNMKKSDFNLIFAGNIGRFQGLETLIEAMSRLKDHQNIHLFLMGDGVAKAGLEEMASKLGANVTFVKHQPVSTAKLCMREASAGFVSLMPGIYKYAYPSKTMTYLEQGCPLLVAVEPDSNLAQDVLNEKVGVTVPAGDAIALSEAILDMASSKESCLMMKQRAFNIAEQQFSEQKILPLWSGLLDE